MKSKYGEIKGQVLVLDKQTYLDARGAVCLEPPSSGSLLGAPGRGIPLAQAEALGMIDKPKPKAKPKATATKAVRKQEDK